MSITGYLYILGHVARNADETKEKLLLAATAEFAAYGAAGARIDRIAERAGVNKRMIYAYFGNKEQLFETVLEHSLALLAEAVPLTADDLPGYAGRLFDYLADHPERHRLALWRTLESSPPTEAEARATAEKLAALSAGQAHDSKLDAAAMLVFIMALVRAWPSTYGALARPTFADAAAQRASVVEAVRRLTAP
jgi:AcrR family transcriptional regulator